MERQEDARMLAYERKPANGPQEKESDPVYVVLRDVTSPAAQKREASDTFVPPPTINDIPPERGRRRKEKEPDVLVFHYPDGERSLQAAKKRIKENPELRYHRARLADGTDCFEIVSQNKVIERYIISRN